MNVWHLIVGLSFALEALAREEDCPDLLVAATDMLDGKKYEDDPPTMVKDRFAKFAQDCRLTLEETEELRQKAFTSWKKTKRQK